MAAITMVKAKHLTTLEKAQIYLELLDYVKHYGAQGLRVKLRKQVDSSVQQVRAGSSHYNSARQMKVAVTADSKDLKALVTGIYAVAEATDPGLFAKLPDRGTWTSMASNEQADHIEAALREAGGSAAETYADLISAVSKRRLDAMQALVALGSSAQAASNADDSVAELKLVIAEADLFLRKLAPEGSELAALLKKARGSSKSQSKSSKASKSKTTSPAPAEGATSTSASTSPAPSTSASTPSSPAHVPSPPAAVIVAPPAVTLPMGTPVQSQPAPVAGASNTVATPAAGVAPPPQVAATPAANPAGAVAVMSEPIGTSPLNGAAH